MRDWLLGFSILGLIALAIVAAVAHRPVEVYVWARDVSVCASVAPPGSARL